MKVIKSHYTAQTSSINTHLTWNKTCSKVVQTVHLLSEHTLGVLCLSLHSSHAGYWILFKQIRFSHTLAPFAVSYLSLVWPSQHSLLGWLNHLLTSSNSRLRNHSQIPPFMYLQSWIPDLLLLFLFCKHTWPSYILHFYLPINGFTRQQNANCSQFWLQYMVTVLSGWWKKLVWGTYLWNKCQKNEWWLSMIWLETPCRVTAEFEMESQCRHS